MEKVTLEILKKAANNLLFDMSFEQYQTLLNEFDIIQQQMQIIGKLKNIDDVSPMIFPFDVSISYLREDIAKTPLSQQDALRNAHDVVLGQIKLPKVVH